MDKPPHILVVDDNREIRELLARYLREQGMAATTLGGGQRLFVTLEEKEVDLLVLDLMLPGEGGVALCRRLRRKSSLPVIMLTALGEHGDRIAGLDAGADDYLTKPFGVPELLARVRALLRRAARPHAEDAPLIRFGEVEVDLVRRLVTRRGEEVHL
ncbi:MAG: response regulator transcription factor, partial [Magnetococcales bacterium]|nr:response regulator transcription factor [Magnetococcales bacterium]